MKVPGMKSDSQLAPGLIAALPHLNDPNFSRTVVLLIRCNDQGAFGLVVNRGTGVSLRDFCQGQDVDYRCLDDGELNVGGPVEQENHLLVLHGEPPVFGEGDEDELELAPGIRLITAMAGLRALAARESARFRCYLGYAGWAPGQLEWELSQGAWVPLPCTPKYVFDVPAAKVWEQALRAAGIDPISLVPGDAIN